VPPETVTDPVMLVDAPLIVHVPPLIVNVEPVSPLEPSVTAPPETVVVVPEKPLRLDVPPENVAVDPPETVPTPDINVPPVTERAPVSVMFPVSVNVPPFHVAVVKLVVYVLAPARVPVVPVSVLDEARLSPCVTVSEPASIVMGFVHVRPPVVKVPLPL